MAEAVITFVSVIIVLIGIVMIVRSKIKERNSLSDAIEANLSDKVAEAASDHVVNVEVTNTAETVASDAPSGIAYDLGANRDASVTVHTENLGGEDVVVEIPAKKATRTTTRKTAGTVKTTKTTKTTKVTKVTKTTKSTAKPAKPSKTTVKKETVADKKKTTRKSK